MTNCPNRPLPPVTTIFFISEVFPFEMLFLGVPAASARDPPHTRGGQACPESRRREVGAREAKIKPFPGYRFGMRISFNFAMSDGFSSYKLAKIFAVVGPSMGATSKSALFASATNSGSRSVFTKACCSA